MRLTFFSFSPKQIGTNMTHRKESIHQIRSFVDFCSCEPSAIPHNQLHLMYMYRLPNRFPWHLSLPVKHSIAQHNEN